VSAHNKPFLPLATEADKIEQLAESVSFRLKDLKHMSLDHRKADESEYTSRGEERFRKLNKYERWLYMSYVKEFKEYLDDMTEWVNMIEATRKKRRKRQRKAHRKRRW
jgi:PP-loop superfamily ATP-utilizing enzyme